MSFSMLELLIVLRQQRNKGFNSSDIMRNWCATVSFIVYSFFSPGLGGVQAGR